MATIDNLIKVTISNETAAVSLPSFAVPLILGKTDPGWDAGDVVHAYSEPAGLLSDGFEADSPEYLSALTMFSGNITPTLFLVGTLGDASNLVDALSAIRAQNDTWYGLILAAATDGDILALAPIIESEQKMLFTSSVTPGLKDSANKDNLGVTLAAKGYKRTVLTHTIANTTGIVEAGWVGGQLPQTPGSNNWAYKTLPGVQVDTFNANQLQTLYGVPVAGVPGRNINAYVSVGGTPVMFPGITSGGQYIDITIGFDWLMANIKTNLFATLSAASKVPYTNAGAAMLMSAVNEILRQGATNGLIDDKDPDFPITVTCQPVSQVQKAKRAARIAPNIYFTCRLQGAFNSVDINGIITV
ncbi:MAG: DUF3383 family protein [Cytophagaceae bacterium]|nr:MAG: DUF3383 family protein [Cytophagaceae bacterium]